MHIRYGYAIEIECQSATPIVAMLDVHPQQRADITEPDEMTVEALLTGEQIAPEAPYLDPFGNICRRVVVPAGGARLSTEGVIYHSGFPDSRQPGARLAAPENLPSECLHFLTGSRYCETDKLSDFAWRQFGQIENGWSKVQAVCDFVHNHLRFDYSLARNTRTAFEAFDERVGVCRDFAHLAIALCRALNVPTRYCTGYLGDIGVPADPSPMDFSAWFEVYLDGRWWTFDARHNVPRIGRIVIGRGRDAADVPILNSFGQHVLRRFDVITEEVIGVRFPVSSQMRRDRSQATGAPFLSLIRSRP